MSNAKMPIVNAEIYKAFKTAIEIGKWPDGRQLSQAQKETCMEAILAYEVEHLPPREHTGFIDKGHKEGDVCDDPSTQILKFDK